jgi:hypothetical protein
MLLFPPAAGALDCGDMPCADTQPPASMNEPMHLGGGSAKEGCVRYLAESGRRAGMPIEQIISSTSGCGVDRALTRIIVMDELGSK